MGRMYSRGWIVDAVLNTVNSWASSFCSGCIPRCFGSKCSCYCRFCHHKTGGKYYLFESDRLQWKKLPDLHQETIRKPGRFLSTEEIIKSMLTNGQFLPIWRRYYINPHRNRAIMTENNKRWSKKHDRINNILLGPVELRVIAWIVKRLGVGYTGTLYLYRWVAGFYISQYLSAL